MQKKIVAAICAAALALAMPAAAFAKTSEWVNTTPDASIASMAVANFGKIDGTSADLMSAKVTGTTSAINAVEVAATDASGYAVDGKNVLAVQAFKFTPKKDGKTVDYLGSKYQEVSGTIQFNEKVIASLPPTISNDNLYVQVTATSLDGTYMGITGQKKLDTAANNGQSSISATVAETATSFQFTGSAANNIGTVTAVLTNGPLYANPSMATNGVDDLEKSAADSSKSPKTGELR